MCVILSLLNLTVCQVTPLAFVVNAINRVNFGFGFEQMEQKSLARDWQPIWNQAAYLSK